VNAPAGLVARVTDGTDGDPAFLSAVAVAVAGLFGAKALARVPRGKARYHLRQLVRMPIKCFVNMEKNTK
jgi:hypothetical protein